MQWVKIPAKSSGSLGLDVWRLGRTPQRVNYRERQMIRLKKQVNTAKSKTGLPQMLREAGFPLFWSLPSWPDFPSLRAAPPPRSDGRKVPALIDSFLDNKFTKILPASDRQRKREML